VVFGNAWIGLFSAVMTALILFLSEIVDEMDSVADMQASARLQWNKRVQSLGIFEQDEDVEPGKSIRS